MNLETALVLYRDGDNMFRARVKIRIAARERLMSFPSPAQLDSVFLHAVEAEHRQEPLP